MEAIEIINLKDFGSGENSNQNAYIAPVTNGVDYEILSHNKELNYTDILNLSELVKILGEFFDVNASAAVKEDLICGAALGKTSFDAFVKMADSDPISIIGATVGFTKNVTLNIAKQIGAMKVKIVMAAEFDKDAYQYLLDTDITIIKINTPLHEIQGFCEKDIKVTPFGVLVQEQNLNKLGKENFRVATTAKPSQEQAEDAIFGWKIAKHLKSRAVVIAKDLCAKAIVQSKTNNVDAIEHAVDIACENAKDAVLVVDSCIDNPKSINSVIQSRIGLIIESGTAQNSKEILKLADKYNISVIYTGLENNKY